MTKIKKTCFRTLVPLVASFVTVAMLFGCASEPPDTSAPRRHVVERSSQWQDALLYIADRDGPVPEWGSIHVFDNVSGFVEMSIEQTMAAAPSDMFVTPDGSSMYVASSSNGRIDEFRWDGKSWHQAGNTIDSPASSLLTLSSGPDDLLYAADGSADAGSGRFFKLDPATGVLSEQPVMFLELGGATGISWNHEGTRVFISGTKASGSPVLLSAAWPSLQEIVTVELPLAQANQVVTSPDDRQVFVMGIGGIATVDTVTMAVTSVWSPSGSHTTEYRDADFSLDGLNMFTAGIDTGGDSTLYVVRITDLSVVQQVKHIGTSAGGIQRVE